MGFDDKIMKLSRTIYQTSVMDHGSKNNPTGQINKIKDMIREFIRMEVSQNERLLKLNQIAITQIKSITNNSIIQKLKE